VNLTGYSVFVVSPEVLAIIIGDHPDDVSQLQSQDVWGLGCLLVFMLTNQNAFCTASPAILRQAHSQWVSV